MTWILGPELAALIGFSHKIVCLFTSMLSFSYFFYWILVTRKPPQWHGYLELLFFSSFVSLSTHLRIINYTCSPTLHIIQFFVPCERFVYFCCVVTGTPFREWIWPEGGHVYINR